MKTELTGCGFNAETEDWLLELRWVGRESVSEGERATIAVTWTHNTEGWIRTHKTDCSSLPGILEAEMLVALAEVEFDAEDQNTRREVRRLIAKAVGFDEDEERIEA